MRGNTAVVYDIRDKLAYDVRQAMPAPGNEHWYVVRVHATDEATAIPFLEKRGFGVYSPRTMTYRPVPRDKLSRKQRHLVGGIRKPVIIPVFPGYLFLRFDMMRSDWHRTFEFLGVAGLVCHGNLPAIIADCEIERVRSLEGIDGVIPGDTPAALLVFAVGEHVKVMAGPFAQFDGVIEEMPAETAEVLKTHTLDQLDDSFRVKVAVLMFGRRTPIDLSVTSIAKI
jgi:transcriptional antiterminator NusG